MPIPRRCPWCQKLIMPVKIYNSVYRHCGRRWIIDKKGMIYSPTDLRKDPGYDSKMDSWEVDVTPKPENNETSNS